MLTLQAGDVAGESPWSAKVPVLPPFLQLTDSQGWRDGEPCLSQ